MGESESRRLNIERYAAGELSGAAASELESHMLTCQSCGGYLLRLQNERRQFLAAHPFTDLLPRLAPEPKRWVWFGRVMSLFSAPALRPVFVPAFSLLLVAVVLTPVFMHRHTPALGDFTAKGTGSVLSYIYKRDGVTRTAEAGQLFKSGDAVQVFYSSASSRNLTLFSIDTEGNVSFYQPDAGSAVCSIPSGKGSRLAYPQSIELDSTPGSELVVALFSAQPFDTNRIKEWVAANAGKGGMAGLEQALKGNPPVSGCEVATVVLKKG